MAAIKTLDFLPAVFQTDTNKKFLSATLDQLVSEPDFKKVNGYIGRRFAPTFKAGDNYVTEPNNVRQQYQLEPSVVVENKGDNTIDHYSGYTDLLQKIEYYGGLTNNHSRLFNSESYSYDGLFDFDKFVNFNNYYWLPDGPDAVDVFAGTVDNQATYTVTRNVAGGGYNFTNNSTESNPVLTLARGGLYKFIVNQPGVKFWIQTEPGTTGVKKTQPNLSTRDVFGVKNNGIDAGIVTFRVPLETAQQRFIDMRLVTTADAAVKFSYTDIQNTLLSTFLANNPTGLDGITTNLNNAKIIFVNSDIDDSLWTNPALAGLPPGFPSVPGYVVPENDRRGVWKINLVPNGAGDFIINLEKSYDVAQNEKVFVRTGAVSATLEYYVDYNLIFQQVPTITSPLTRLYYQDSANASLIGEIKIVDQNNHTIDIEQDILGKTTYTSPNGVKFTNGLKVRFDTKVIQAEYAEKEYYVEGVGSSIGLVAVETQLLPEAFAHNGINTADYITINRDCLDSNPWARSNRWFHIDVITATAGYNKTTALPSQNQRANRPIIEFEKNLQLFDYGRVAKKPVDILYIDIAIGDRVALSDDEHGVVIGAPIEDPTRWTVELDNGSIVTPKKSDVYVDAFTDIEGNTGVTINGVELADGMRIIFANDPDPVVENKIYNVSLVDIDGISSTEKKIHLSQADDGVVEAYNTLIVLQGTNKGLAYWYDGANWQQGQLKSSINQPPLFDIVDDTDVSFGNTGKYLNTSFAGTKIFSYKAGTGKDDSVLGFPLSYKNFNSVGDIEFINDFDSETITYLNGQDTVSVSANSGFARKNLGLLDYNNKNVWTKTKEKTKQYQIISTVFEGVTNYVEIDILPEADQTIPYIKVFVNNQLLNSTQYSIKKVGARDTVVIDKSLLTLKDKIDIIIYSRSASEIGYYEIPDNLEFNPLNVEFESMTLGQLRNHTKIIEQNTKIITDYNGTFTSLRDIDYKTNGGSIVQHGSPMIFSNIFLTDKNLNFVEGVSYASREYTKFKNKFLELSVKLDEIDTGNIPGSVDTIIKNINLVKNSSFPWYYSDMVPSGDNSIVLDYTIINPLIKQYEINKVFTDTELGYQAVLVYLNGVQLVKGQDYYFPQDRTAVILTDSLETVADDKLLIVEYQDTTGCYVPETPTKLGLYPKFRPSKYLDDTYQTPINVIRGHDGSIIPAFNDYRDDLLLELEKRIYNNIKINVETNIFELYDYLPGKFRSTEYNLTEFNRVLTKNFLKWVGFNKVNFTANDYFESGDAWTWNYKKIPDSINGATLPGTWRAIYNYWFDTDRPHTHPWEMLGFSEEPTWWQERYGSAPYTGGNTLLWSDLSQGYIYAGTRAGYDVRFARPQLLRAIPVDEYGELISPEKFAVGSFDSQSLNASFAIGDQGPVETAWRRSSDYPYALQQALALLKPAYYFGSLINVSEYTRDTTIDQLVRTDTKQRITPTTVCINGEVLDDGGIQPCSGYLNWIIDYVTHLGINGPIKVREMLDNLDVRLGYNVAGYTDQKYVKVLAEQSSPTSTNNSIIIPDENYRVHLHKSSPVKKSVYSAVIVERSENGYTVSGYDTGNPYFTIIPSLANNNAYAITAVDLRAVIYRDFQSRKVTVPYGFEFKTRQQVVDFLVSYGRYLTGQGFRFDEQDSDLKSQRDWVLSAQEFLTWSQQGWKAGSLIVLSPTYNYVKFISPAGVIDHIENTITGPKILDQNFNVIKNNQFTVLRYDNQFSLQTANGQTICLAELDVVQYEHALLFDNTTVFNDIIYKPELGNRQYRLKLVGNKTASWTGNLNPPGFVYNSPNVDSWQPGVDYRKGAIVTFKEQYYTALNNIIASIEFNQNDWQMIDRLSIKTGLLPNFAYNAQKFENIYDVDNQPVDGGLDAYSNGLIGFRNRDYLSDFSLDQISQTKFYQGYIKEKGTLNAITALTNAQFNNITSNIDIYEEWAIRVGEYGALESDQVLDITLNESDFSNDPSSLVMLGALDPLEGEGVVNVRYQDLYRRPDTFKKDIFFNRGENTNYSNDILTAGYVNVDDVDGTLFNFSAYATLDDVTENLGKGYKLWVAKDFDDNWNVYRLNETNNAVISLDYGLDGYMTVNFEKPHHLTVDRVFAIKNFDPQFNGYYNVEEVTSSQSVSVIIHKNEATLKSAGTISGNGVFFTLDSVRVNSPTDIPDLTPINGWLDGDRIWVDNYTNENWAVLEKSSPWDFSTYLTPQLSEYNADLNFGRSAKLSSTTELIIVGAPGKNETKTFTKTPAGDFIQTNTLRPQNENVVGFGTTVDVSDFVVVVGAPASFNHKGCAYVFSIGSGTGITGQILVDEESEDGSEFGESIAISQDNQWLYIGAPGENAVYCYKLNKPTTFRGEVLTNGEDSTFKLYEFEVVIIEENTETVNISVAGDDTAPVYLNGVLLVKDVDYTRDATLLTFASTLYAGSQVKVGMASFAPNSTGSITVSANNKRYIPEIDFKVVDDEITFYEADGVTEFAPLTDTIVINQGPYYKFVKKLTENDLEVGDRFGATIATNYDGTEVYVGVPEKTVDGQQRAGSVYTYNRRSQSFRTVEGINTFITTELSNEDTIVTLDGGIKVLGEDYRIIDSAIRFNEAPPSGRIVTATQTEFDHIQRLVQPMARANSKFGSSITVDYTSSSLFVGAPIYSLPTYQSGAVYRFVDAAKITGYAVGSIANPVVTAGSAIYINGFRVQFTGTSVDDVAGDINAANLPGVTASVVAGKLNLVSSSASAIKLQFRDYGGSALAELGLEAYSVGQIITHPDFGRGENFGYRVAINETGDTLIVSSDKASTLKQTTFETALTTFDNASTRFIDRTKNSGAVYQYELLQDTIQSIADTGSFVYVQQLVSDNIVSEDQFGSSIDISKTYALVGAPSNDKYVKQGGIIHLFENANNEKSWKVTRQQQDKVDLDSINRLFIYNKNTNIIVNNLDFIDPAKGKILGIAEQDIDYKTSFDPATYNTVTGWADQISQFNSNYFWSEQQVGRVWWDLSKVRYIDYEQGSLTYRLKNWGSTFPGSSIDVYEWVESPVVPSLYESTVADGEPLYDDDSAFSIVTSADADTGIIKTKYYFWVKNKNKIAPTGKNNSTSSIANIIENPRLQSIPYATILKSNSIGLHGIKDLLNSDNIVLHVDYANVRNSNTIHSEFELISENNSNSVIPNKILNKLIDSLSGLDRLGQVVPDNTLSAVDRLGISIRPRQTMVSNRSKALENFVKYVNQVFVKHPIAIQYNINNLYSEEALPDNTADDQWHKEVSSNEELDYINTDDLAVGFRVLVASDTSNSGLWAIYQLTEAKQFVLYRIQSYKTDLYWDKINWYADGYSSTDQITHLVDTVKDIAKIRLVAGDTIKVRYGATGSFEIYIVNDSLGLEIVGLENGTIKLKDTIYNLPKGKMSYDEDNFDIVRYDQTPSYEIRQIINTIKDDIFVGDLKVEFNKLFFVIINYILAEQKNVDWIFKTSFINVVHQLRKLEQFPSFIKDNQDYYSKYIDEVKPYRTQVREYLLSYSGDDVYSGDVTDFDLPSYYDTITSTYRSPNGEQAGDSVRLNQAKYSNWKNNHTYIIDSITVDRPGTGFITAPEIKITGGGGSGATAEAEIDFSTGELIAINVLKSGSGYNSTPTVTINGTGTGAAAYPILKNSKIRQFNSTLKFDRITYSSEITNWQANVEYTANTIVSFDGVAWQANANVAALSYFDRNNFNQIDGSQVGNAADRVKAYYRPGAGLPGQDPEQVFSGIEYPGVLVQGLDFSANVDFAANAALIDSYIQSTFKDTLLGTRAEDINIDGGAFYDTFSSHAPEELVPGIIFDNLNLQVFTREIDDNGEVMSNGRTLGIRVMSNMSHQRSYCRIAEANTAVLTSNLSVTDTTISVDNALRLPHPGIELSQFGTWIVVPGKVIINGEEIYYYKNYAYNTPWQGNLIVEVGTDVSYNGNVYTTTGNVYDANGTFGNVSSNMTYVGTTNSLGRIRRAVNGTGAPLVHLANAMVVDCSVAQDITFAGNVWGNAPDTGATTTGNTSSMFGLTTVSQFLMEHPSFTP
jgi:hypothetical protein